MKSTCKPCERDYRLSQNEAFENQKQARRNGLEKCERQRSKLLQKDREENSGKISKQLEGITTVRRRSTTLQREQ